MESEDPPGLCPKIIADAALGNLAVIAATASAAFILYVKDFCLALRARANMPSDLLERNRDVVMLALTALIALSCPDESLLVRLCRPLSSSCCFCCCWY